MKIVGLIFTPIIGVLIYLEFGVSYFSGSTLIIVGVYLVGMLLINKPLLNMQYILISLASLGIYSFLFYSIYEILDYNVYVINHIEYYSYTPDFLFLTSSLSILGLAFYLNIRAIRVNKLLWTSWIFI